MQHLIKRSTGNSARNDSRRSHGTTLAERLAASRQQARMIQASALEEGEVADDAAMPAPDPAPAEPTSKAESAPAPEPEMIDSAAASTDSIVDAAKASRTRPTPAAGAGQTCLIVDDSRVIRKLAGQIVSDLGYTVIEAENGEEALARCGKHMPALVITDWNMPVMSGIDFVMTLRSMPESRAPIVVFCTSKGEATDIHAGISAGADDYLVKPFTEQTLTAKLKKLGLA